LGGAFKTVEQKASDAQSKLKRLKVGQSLASDLLNYKEKIASLQQLQGASITSTKRLDAQLGSLYKKYNNAVEKAKEYGITLGNLTGKQKQFEVEIGRVTRALERQQTRMRNKQVRGELRGQIVGTVGMAMAAAAPVKAAMNFETTMAEVKKVVNFDTPQQFKAMSKDILQLSTVMPMAASGIGDIVAAAGQSGIARDELMDFAKSAVTMGVAFDLTGDQAGKMMANWRAGMGLNQKQAVSLADAVNYLANNMNAEAGALGEVLQRQGAVAMAAGLTETQTASLGAALLSSGAGPERAATALKNLTGALTMGTAATKSQEDALAALGLDAEEMAKAMQTDAKGAILDVFNALAQAAPEERGALVSQLFGEESKGAIMPLLSNLDNLKKAFSLTADQTLYAGSMQKEYEERANTSANKLQLMRNQLTRMAVSLGSVLLPTVSQVFGVIGSGAGLITDAAERFPGLTKVVVGAATGLAAFKVAALSLRYAGTVFSDGWQAAKATMDFFRISTVKTNVALAVQKAHVIGTAIAQAAAAVKTKALAVAQWAWNAALSANPIGLVVLAIGALVAGAALVIKYWEPIKEFFVGLWDVVSSIGSALTGSGSGIGGDIGSASEVEAAMAGAAPHRTLALAGARNPTTVNSAPQYIINAAPGMNTEDVGKIVEQKQREHEARLAARQRGALYDGEDFD
jgi:TP901 family phage tail tape measure protein